MVPQPLIGSNIEREKPDIPLQNHIRIVKAIKGDKSCHAKTGLKVFSEIK